MKRRPSCPLHSGCWRCPWRGGFWRGGRAAAGGRRPPPPGGGGVMHPPAAPPTRNGRAGAAAVREEKPRTLKGWGKITDADGDCTVKARKGMVTIKVPGGTHDLNRAIGMNGPRVLKEVEGDFTDQVKVTGDFDPGDKAA